jgi:hypothetical protein
MNDKYGNEFFMSVDGNGNVAPLLPIKSPGLNKEQAVAFAAWMLVLARASKQDICTAIEAVESES